MVTHDTLVACLKHHDDGAADKTMARVILQAAVAPDVPKAAHSYAGSPDLQRLVRTMFWLQVDAGWDADFALPTRVAAEVAGCPPRFDGTPDSMSGWCAIRDLGDTGDEVISRTSRGRGNKPARYRFRAATDEERLDAVEWARRLFGAGG